MKRLSALLLLLILLLPNLASAAPGSGSPRPISPGEYRAMLQAGVARLERADQLVKAGKNPEALQEMRESRSQLSGNWRVESRNGSVTGNLTDLDDSLGLALVSQEPQRHISQLLTLAREHLAAAEALERAEGVSVPGARQTLDEALKQTTARTVLQRLNDWWNQLLSRQLGRANGTAIPNTVWWIAGGLALLALIWMGFSLYRSLSGHAAAGDASLKSARHQQPERPLTPLELWESARGLSERGEHLEAIRRAHLALLQRYDALQLIRYIPAQTNREHERQLRRRHPPLARTLRTLNDLVDDRLYSGHGAAPADFLRVDALVDQLWREGDAVSTGAKATTGASSSA